MGRLGERLATVAAPGEALIIEAGILHCRAVGAKRPQWSVPTAPHEWRAQASCPGRSVLVVSAGWIYEHAVDEGAARAIAASPDGRLDDATARVWNVATRAQRHTFEVDQPSTVHLSLDPDGRHRPPVTAARRRGTSTRFRTRSRRGGSAPRATWSTP